jgi:hypothetical protein
MTKRETAKTDHAVRQHLTALGVWAARSWLVLALIVEAASDSYGHLLYLAVTHGQYGLSARVGALIFDGLAVYGAQQMRRDRLRGLTVRYLSAPRLVCLTGLSFTIAGNWCTSQPTPWGRIWGVAAPVSLMIAVLLYEREADLDRQARQAREDREDREGQDRPVPAVQDRASQPGPASAVPVPAVPARPVPARRTAPGPGLGVLPEGYELPKGPHDPDEDLQVIGVVMEAYADLNNGRAMSAEALKRTLHINKGRALQLRDRYQAREKALQDMTRQEASV